MVYTRQYATWHDLPDTSTPATAAVLDGMEQGIVDATSILPISTHTADFTLGTDKEGTICEVNSTIAVTVTVPPHSSIIPWDVGAVICLYQANTGAVNVAAGAGVTIQSPSTMGSAAQYSTIMLRYRGSDTWTLSGALGTSAGGYSWLFQGEPDEEVARFTPGTSSSVRTIFDITDSSSIPILWLLNTGGLFLNDNMQLARSVFGPVSYRSDIYGYVSTNNHATYRHEGPPGNMLDFATATGETFQGNRSANPGQWITALGASVVTAIANPFGGTTNPGEQFNIISVAPGTGSNLVARTSSTPGVFVPAVAGNYLKAMVWMRGAAGAASHSITVTATSLDSTGATTANVITSSATTVTNAGWTQITLSGVVAGGTTAGFRLDVAASGIAAGDTFYLTGAGIWVDNRTTSSADPNAENAWSPPFTGQTDGVTGFGFAKRGDMWIRTDAVGTQGKRIYMLDASSGTAFYKPNQVYAPGSTAQPSWVSVDGAATTTSTNVIPSSSKTSSYTLALSDIGSVVEFNASSGVSCTIPPSSSVAWPSGAVIEVYQTGAGQITIAPGSGVTLQTSASLTARAQFSTISLRYRGSNTWAVAGDLT